MSQHDGWNNFLNEGAPSRALYKLLPPSGNTPPSVTERYVNIVTRCRIGNGYGVSNIGAGYCDHMIALWQDDHIRLFVKQLLVPEVASSLQFDSCAKNFRAIAATLIDRATSPRVKSLLTRIVEADAAQLSSAYRSNNFLSVARTL